MIEQTIREIEDQLKIKRYAPSTCKTYLSFLRKFFYFHNIEPEHLTELDVKPFIQLLMETGLSHSTQNQAINAIKFYFEKVRMEPTSVYYFDRPRKQVDLPTILSKSEIKKILEGIINLKHKSMISLIYACGLRAGELVALELKDIDSDRMVIAIRKAKGNKDRIVPLSQKILELLRAYYREFRPKQYLFQGEGERPLPYSLSSLRKILKRAALRAGIKKNIRLHTLRHSYATHLLESGVSLRHIQLILGHNSSRTTEIYTHVSKTELCNIKSPIEDLL